MEQTEQPHRRVAQLARAAAVGRRHDGARRDGRVPEESKREGVEEGGEVGELVGAKGAPLAEDLTLVQHGEQVGGAFDQQQEERRERLAARVGRGGEEAAEGAAVARREAAEERPQRGEQQR